MKPYYTIILLIFSNVLMTIAWYAHLKFTKIPFFSNLGLFG
ncbi:MAG: DMT family protein, partial [Campylobacter sp.]|nr:DMT family protein [Campylobacter sp.]